MRLANAFYKKRDEQLVTYREVGVTIEHPIQRGTHEQINFVIVANRWKNIVLNVESDVHANISTDHYPLMAKLKIKLKAMKLQSTTRPRLSSTELLAPRGRNW